MATTFRMLSTRDDPEGFYYSEQPDPYFDPQQPEHRYDNPRTMLVANFPELEVSYSNADRLLALVDLTNEPDMGTCGTVEVTDLPVVMRRLIQLQASSKQRKPMLSGDRQERNFFEQGNSDDRINRYIAGLLLVVKCCQDNNRALTWA